MKLARLPMLLLVVAVLGACTKKLEAPPAPKTAVAPAPVAVVQAQGRADAHADPRDDAIAWRRGDVDAAFAEARTAGKPVFLYWGAAWCPPCNQMKATLFRKQEFVERTQHFVPVYVDGDTPAAQKLGTRFSVSGYPTMVLFRPDGTEITRLPGEADPERYLQVLAMGMSARPVRTTLATALGDGRGLTQDDWRMLAWYSWDTDDQQLVPSAQVPATLQKLAARCPAGFDEASTRLMLKTAAAAASGSPSKGTNDARPKIDRKAVLARVESVLGDPVAARANFDLVTGAMPEIVRALTTAGSPDRKRVVANADRTLAALARDATLSNTDRLGATIARVQLATLDAPQAASGTADAPVALPDALRDEVTAEVARADRESTDPFERQTVVNAAAYLLATAGMLDRSDALLTAELTRSHSPYYFMLDLASNAKQRGDKAAAIDWYGKAYDAAKGPATRLQWGATYVAALIELSPDDAARIERTAGQVLGEVEPVPESFDGRNRKNLSKISTKLAAWNTGGRHADAATRLADRSRQLCDRLSPQAPARMQCGTLLKVGVPMQKPTALNG